MVKEQSTNPQTLQQSNNSTNQQINKQTNKRTSRQINQSTNQPINKQTNKSTNKQTNQSTNQSTNQQTNKPANQQTNQPTYLPTYLYIHTSNQAISCGRSRRKLTTFSTVLTNFLTCDKDFYRSSSKDLRLDNWATKAPLISTAINQQITPLTGPRS